MLSYTCAKHIYQSCYSSFTRIPFICLFQCVLQQPKMLYINIETLENVKCTVEYWSPVHFAILWVYLTESLIPEECQLIQNTILLFWLFMKLLTILFFSKIMKNSALSAHWSESLVSLTDGQVYTPNPTFKSTQSPWFTCVENDLEENWKLHLFYNK